MQIEIVKCLEKYWDFVKDLRNDSRLKSGFIEQKIITHSMQQKYMRKYHAHYMIGLYNKDPAGYVGVIENDIRICVHPDFQKLGVGKALLMEAVRTWPQAIAKIKIENEASLKLFEAAGFEKRYYILNRGEKDDTI